MSKKSLRNTFCSIILLVTISFSLCGNTFATAFDPQYVFEKQFHSEQKAIDEQYDKHMFSFNEPSSIVTSKLLTDQSYEATVDFISSLDLSNYPDVKEANLRYIEQLHKRGCVIRTYTVFTPKSSAQTLRLGDDLLYYGSYHGRDYHTREYGESTYDIAKNTETSTQRLNYFINGALDVFVGLAGSVVSYPYSTIRSIVGMPQNFTVNSGDKMESYIRVHATFKRDIYTRLQPAIRRKRFRNCQSDDN